MKSCFTCSTSYRTCSFVEFFNLNTLLHFSYLPTITDSKLSTISYCTLNTLKVKAFALAYNMFNENNFIALRTPSSTTTKSPKKKILPKKQQLHSCSARTMNRSKQVVVFTANKEIQLQKYNYYSFR